MNILPAHFGIAKQLKANNTPVIGVALMDDDWKMKGSMMIVQFKTKDDLA